MKNVWILEKWIDRNRCVELKNEFIDMYCKGLKEAKVVIDHYNDMLNDSRFEGYWCGFVGKSKYNDFCYEAARTLKQDKNSKFRVVKAQIENTAKEWTNYVNPIENEGVLRYLHVKTKYV